MKMNLSAMTPDEQLASYQSLMAEYGVPTHLREGLALYLVERLQPGHFLTEVLRNNLVGAVSRGHDESLAGLPHLVRFLYNQAPAEAWGSSECVVEWLTGREEMLEARARKAAGT